MWFKISVLILTKVTIIILQEVEMEYVDYGYCRISTLKQNIDRQERNILKVYPAAHIIKETFTGTKFDGRKEWNQLYKRIIKQAETKRIRLIIDSISRFSRNADEGCELYEDLFRRGVTIVFLQEGHINTDVYREALQRQIDIFVNTGNKATDKLLNTIIDALNQFVIDLAKQQIRIAFEQAQKEVDDLHQRTKEGIETARLAGKQIGQKKGAKLTTKKSVEMKGKIVKMAKCFEGNMTDSEVISILGLARNTYYKYKKELLQDKN